MVCVIYSVALSQSTSLTFNNTAKYVGKGTYDWTVYVDADANTLAQIQSVEYTLDPSFPNPIRKVTTRKNKFALPSNGWGEFTIYAKVFFANGKTSTYKYRLNLVKADRVSSNNVPGDVAERTIIQTSPPSVASVNVEAASISTGNTSKSLGNGGWEWSVFVVASDDVLSQIQYVEYTLHPTFPDPIQHVMQRGLEKGKGFTLKATGWGTFEIAVKIVFTNGKTRFLKHQLKFG